MFSYIHLLLGLVWVGFGISASLLDGAPSPSHAGCFVAVGGIFLAVFALRLTYYRSGTTWPQASPEPKPLRLRWMDLLKVVVSSFDAFKRTYAVEPGLYYTGDAYKKGSPLLVTSNYRLTIFLLLRNLRPRNVRVLVVDTDGINVWCAASKGQFGNQSILAQVDRYPRELLTDEPRLEVILPKLGMPGVDLQALKRAKIRPVIGPVYAKDLPGYLDQPPLKDRSEDGVVFGLRSRFFTWLPCLLQNLRRSLTIVAALLGAEWVFGFSTPLELLGLTAILATGYPILFPWLPGNRFAVKGLSLAALVVLGLVVTFAFSQFSTTNLLLAVLFTLASGLFIGLEYSGNSPVSNYSKVRREIARFLPLNILLYMATAAVFLTTELMR